MNTTLSSLALLPFIALANIALVAEEPPRFAGAPRIATVDIDTVVRESREYQTKLADVRDAMEARKQNLARVDRDEMKRIADKAKTFAPGTAEYRAAEEASLSMTRCDLGGGNRDAESCNEADQARARLFAEVHAKARVEIAAYAREQHFQLVINSTPSAARPEGRCCCCGADISDTSIWSRVIYSSHPDITTTIIERLDATSP